MKNIHRAFVVLSLFALASCGQKPQNTTTVKAGTMQTYFTEDAKTYLEDITTINLPVAGKLNKLKLKVGDHVTKGEKLAELQQLPLQEALKKATQEYIAVKNYYHSAVAATKSSLSKRNLARINLRRDQNLIKNNSIPQSVFDATQSGYNVAKATLRENQQIENALSASMKSMESQLRIAKYNLNNSSMVSPTKGTILNRSTEGNVWLSAGAPVMLIGDPTKLEAIASVLSVDAAKLKVGDVVRLGSDGYQYPYSGEVKQIYPAAYTKRSALGVEEQRVKVIITLHHPEALHLGVHFRLYGKFITSVINNALIVPRESVLQATDGQYYVKSVHKDKVVKTYIKVGAFNDNEVQIISGLKKGDIIERTPSIGES